MKVLLSFDEERYNYQKSSYEDLIGIIQEPVSLFNSFGIGDLQPDELSKLFINTNDLLYDKITKGESISIGGLKIDKQKALDILEKPVGYNHLLSLISSCINTLKNHAGHNIQPISVNAISSIYALTEAGEIEFKKQFDEELKNRNMKYATSEVAKKMLELAKQFIEQTELLGLSDIVCNNPNGAGKVLDTIVRVSKDKKLAINTDDIYHQYN